MSETLSMALKEWAVVCDALLSGRQTILLRKGGIYEAAGEFELEHRRFLLFPTYLHQNFDSLKPPYRSLIQPRTTEPDAVQIAGWADAEWITRVPDRSKFDQLDDLHLWDKPLIDMRFNYRPDYPLYLILLRAYRLAQPVRIVVDADYAGCRSWVPLKSAVNIAASQAILTEEQITLTRRRIISIFGSTE
jgi:hypothetical protein